MNSNQPVTLADLTTMHVGGPVRSFVQTATEADFVAAIRSADAHNVPLLVIGGGSNIVAGDAGFDGLVLRDGRTGHEPVENPSVSDTPSVEEAGTAVSKPRPVEITVHAGADWDRFVAGTVRHGWAGVEALSGIPGTVGAAPVQNIGAYGQEVSQTIKSVRVYDRLLDQICNIGTEDLDFGYRESLLKDSMKLGFDDASSKLQDTVPNMRGDNPPRRWYPTPRYVVLAVTFELQPGDVSRPIAYKELATKLGVAVGDTAPLAAVREAVLELRAGKGMLAPVGEFADDHDRWSAGSFFTNPIISAEAAALLPEEAPKFPVKPRAATRGFETPVPGSSTDGLQTPSVEVNETTIPSVEEPTNVGVSKPREDGELVKTSAAWLISNAGFTKGYGVHGPDSKATLSTKHSLALTNRGEAKAEDIAELAREIQKGVKEKFNAHLEPEPITIGFRI